MKNRILLNGESGSHSAVRDEGSSIISDAWIVEAVARRRGGPGRGVSALIGTSLDKLERHHLTTGLVTMCTGRSMGTAMIIERV